MARKKKETVITAFKGFEPDFKCRDFQYEVGKEYEIDGNVECCQRGFHACKVPLNVFKYYAPVQDYTLRRYALVEQSGHIKEDEDKIASSKIKIKEELSIAKLVECHVNFIKKNSKKTKNNTGDCSAATNTGYCSAAINTGNCSAATNTGDCSAATNTGDCSAATNTGYCSVVEVAKENSAAFAFGYQAKARARNGWIILADWRLDIYDNRYIDNIYTAKVGGKILDKEIRSNVWYWFENGELKEQED